MHEIVHNAVVTGRGRLKEWLYHWVCVFGTSLALLTGTFNERWLMHPDKCLVERLERVDHILGEIERDLAGVIRLSTDPTRNRHLLQSIRAQVLGYLAYVDTDANAP